jgi:ubiquinone/menaquinone biosynthesis C-methylase UbiE
MLCKPIKIVSKKIRHQLFKKRRQAMSKQKSTSNEQRFTGLAEVYSKSRPSYHPDAIDYMFSIMQNKNAIIADIGSGTGILTEQLLQRGLRVFGVEPNSDMRDAAVKHLAQYGELFTQIDGNDKNTQLPDHSVDIVTVAQALHWFDLDAFRAECNRILKPRGGVFVLYNEYAGATVDQYYQMLSYHGPSANPTPNQPRRKLGSDFAPEITQQFFGGEVICKRFPSLISYDKEQLVGRALSSSHTPRPGDKGYDDFVTSVAKFFDEHQSNNLVTFENITKVYHI